MKNRQSEFGAVLYLHGEKGATIEDVAKAMGSIGGVSAALGRMRARGLAKRGGPTNGPSYRWFHPSIPDEVIDARIAELLKEAYKRERELVRISRAKRRELTGKQLNALADKFRGTATPKVKQEPKPVVITGMENAPKTVRKAPPGRYEVTGPIIGGLRTTPFGVYQTPPASAMARALGV